MSHLQSSQSMTMDRREFFQHTAAAGTGTFLFGGAPALARSLAPSPNEKVRFACIGVGGKGDSDTNDAGEHGEIVALCDIRRSIPQARLPQGLFDPRVTEPAARRPAQPRQEGLPSLSLPSCSISPDESASIGIARDHFAAADRPQRPPGLIVDGVLD
jgi:hypothetical protein